MVYSYFVKASSEQNINAKVRTAMQCRLNVGSWYNMLEDLQDCCEAQDVWQVTMYEFCSYHDNINVILSVAS